MQNTPKSANWPQIVTYICITIVFGTMFGLLLAYVTP